MRMALQNKLKQQRFGQFDAMRSMSPTYGSGGTPTAASLFQQANLNSYGDSIVSKPFVYPDSRDVVDTGGYGGPGAIPGVSLRSADQLAKLYGVNIDQAAITKAYQDSVNTAYRGANRDFTQNLGDTQMTYLDSMRRGNAAALQSGAAKGMQSANELSAMLGLSQQSVGAASKLSSDQATASQKAVQDAITYADQNKLALGKLSTDLYGQDINREGNYMSIAQQYAQMKSSEGQAAADRALQEKLNSASGTEDDPEIKRWRTILNKKPGEPFTPYEIALVRGVAPADMPGYGLNPDVAPSPPSTVLDDVKNGFFGQLASYSPVFQGYNALYGALSGGKSFLPKKLF